MKGRKSLLWVLLFLLPNFLGFLLFQLGPILASLWLSFEKWDIMSPPIFVRLKNYIDLVSDPLFWQGLKATAYYTVIGVPIAVSLGLVVALLLNRKIKGLKLFRTMYFTPVVCSMVSVAVVWGWLYNRDFGLINSLLKGIGLSPLDWLGDERLAIPSLAIMGAWKTIGYNMVLFLAGLQGIPQQLYEAAEIDGATSWSKFRYITLPLLSPTFFFISITSIIGSFQVFDQVYIMTKGGPGNATRVYYFYLYENAFKFYRMGYASAMAYILLCVILLLTFVQIKFFERFVIYEVT